NLRAAALAQLVRRLDLGERQESKRRAPDMAGEGRLIAEAHRAHTEFLFNKVDPYAPHILACGGVEIERCHERPPLGLGPGAGKVKLDPPLSKRRADRQARAHDSFGQSARSRRKA